MRGTYPTHGHSLADISLPLRQPTVDREFFQATVAALEKMGVDFAATCTLHGLTNPLLLPGSRLPLASISPIYDVIATHTGDPRIVYTLAEAIAFQGTRTQSLEALFGCCRNLGEALRLACRYATTITDVCQLIFRPHGEFVDLQLIPATGAYVSTMQMECTLFILRKHILRLRGRERHADTVQVMIPWEARMPVADYEAIFCCPVVFNQPIYAIRLRPCVLTTPIPGADRRRAAFLADLVDRHTSALVAQGDLCERIQRLYLHHMPFGDINHAELAEKLHMSVRTMQRHLLEIGTTYRELIEHIRYAVAVGELRRPGSRISEVALLLGYHDTRSFFRAFRRWTGLSPQEWRLHQKC